jgi:hypothetical protein
MAIAGTAACIAAEPCGAAVGVGALGTAIVLGGVAVLMSGDTPKAGSGQTITGGTGDPCQSLGDCSSGTDQSRQSPLQRLHSNETIKSSNQSSYNYWSSKSTQEIVDSLKAGQNEPLIVKENGTVMQGNTRIFVLQERGFDVNSLPRVPY